MTNERELFGMVEKVGRPEPPEPEGWIRLRWDEKSSLWSATDIYPEDAKDYVERISHVPNPGQGDYHRHVRLVRIGGTPAPAATDERPTALEQDVLRCLPADWKPGYGRNYGDLGSILSEYIDDLREGRYPPAAPQSERKVPVEEAQYLIDLARQFYLDGHCHGFSRPVVGTCANILSLWLAEERK